MSDVDHIQNPVVRFRRQYRGWAAGEVISTLDYGVAQLFVMRKIADWVDEEGARGQGPGASESKTRKKK